MKNLISVIGLFLILASCSESKKSDPVVYKSLAGKWTFTTAAGLSGSFEVAEFAGKLAVDNTSGSFSYKGKTYNITEKQEFVIDGFKVNFLYITNAVGQYPNAVYNVLRFYRGNYEADFTKMTFPEGVLVAAPGPQEIVNGPITMERAK